MSLLESLKRGWWSGWAEFPELLAGGAGLLESIIPGDRPDDPLERLQRWGEETAKGLRLEGGEGRSEGLLEKIAEGVGAAPGTLASMAPFFLTTPASMGATTAGAIARPAIAFGTHSMVRHGDEGLPTAIGQGLRGAAEGAIFGGVGLAAGKALIPKAAEELLAKRAALTAVGSEQAGAAKRFLGQQLEGTGINTLERQLGRRALHGLGAGAAVGGMTGLHGGSAEDVAAAGATMGLLGMLSSGKFREPALAQERKLAEVRKAIEERAEERGRLLEPAEPTEFVPTEPRPFVPEEAATRFKSPEDPTRVQYDKDVINSLPPERQQELYSQWRENVAPWMPESFSELMASIQRGGLDSEGRVRQKVDAVDTFEAAKNLGESWTAYANLEKRLLAAERSGTVPEMNAIRQQMEALEVDMVARVIPSKFSTSSTAGSSLRGVGLARRFSPEWYDAIKQWEKNLGREMSSEVKRLARLSQGEPDLLARLGRVIDTPKMWDYMMEYWINGLLSGIPTQMVNFESNALRQVIDYAEKRGGLHAEIRASKKGLAPKGKETALEHADVSKVMGADLSAALSAVRLFPRFLKAAWSEGEMARLIEQYPEYAQRTKLDHPTAAIAGKPGEVIRTPGRMLQAMDMYFKSIAGQRAAAYTAYRKAYEAFRKGEITEAEIEPRIQELLGQGGKEPHPDILKAMKREAEIQTFTQRVTGRFGKAVTSAREVPLNVPLLGIEIKPVQGVIPFWQTPWNVIVQAINRSPLGLLRLKQLKKRYESDASFGPEQYYKEVAGTVMGTAVWAGLVGAAKMGLVTGSGPTNYADRQNLLQTGWRPYSVKLGDTYWQMQRLEPLGTVLGLAGDAAELGTTDDLTGKAIAMIKENMTNKSFLYGLESFAQAFANPEQFGSTYYRQMSGSIVPTFFSKVAQAVDPYQRIQEPFGAEAGVPDALAYRIPFVSRALPERTTALGEPAERWGVAATGGPLEGILSGIQSVISAVPISAGREGTEVEREFARLGSFPKIAPSAPRRDIQLRSGAGGSVKLTDDEYDIYNQYHQRAKQHLANVIQMPNYQNLPDAMKAELLRKIYDKYRRAANKQITMMVRKRTTVGS